MKIFGCLIGMVAALALTTSVSASQNPPPGNSGAAHRCSQGGFQNLHQANGSGFGNAGHCTSYAAQGGVFLEDMQSSGAQLTFVSECTPFDDSVYYTYTFGPGAVSANLTYTYTTASGTYGGTVTTAQTAASSGPSPHNYVRSLGLNQVAPGTYSFEMHINYGTTPGTLTVTDGSSTSSAPTPAASTAVIYCAPH